MLKPLIRIVPVAGFLAVILYTGPVFAQQKTVKDCEAEWKANKASIQASGKKKADFMAECRGTSAQPATAPAQTAPSNAAPATTTKPVTPPPAQPAPKAAAKQTKSSHETAALPSGVGQYATDTEAKAHCPSDTVVWANPESKIYHFSGYHDYGHTKKGAFVCEKEVVSAGFRAAKDEKHP